MPENEIFPAPGKGAVPVFTSPWRAFFVMQTNANTLIVEQSDGR